MIIVDLDHVQVAAPEGCEPAARAFYSGLLGLEELKRPPELDGQGGCWFRCGSRQLHVGVELGDFRPARKAHPAFRVSDLPGLRQRLLDAGYRVIDDEMLPDVARFFSADPWGNRLEFIAA